MAFSKCLCPKMYASAVVSTSNLESVKREATPRSLMNLSIQSYLGVLSISHAVSILGVFGVQRARSTVHNWVHNADLQPDTGRSPDHVAVNKTVNRLDDEQYGLYTPVDPETNELLHTKLETAITRCLLKRSSTNCGRNTTLTTRCFSSMSYTC